MAHEVRNPLSTALWSAELLARMPAADRSGPRGEKLTAMCLRSLGRVRQLIEDHFLSERLDAQGIPLHPEPILLPALLEELGGRRGPEAGPLELAVAADLVAVADQALLERALDSLLAVAGREGAAVRVSAQCQDGQVVIKVAGSPPPPGALEDPRKGTNGDPKGRSLALPLVRRIAGVLGGALEIEGGAYVLRVAAPAASPVPG